MFNSLLLQEQGATLKHPSLVLISSKITMYRLRVCIVVVLCITALAGVALLQVQWDGADIQCSKVLLV